MNNAVMTGHSFGGATTLQILRAGQERFPFVRGIALDPWIDPIPKLKMLERFTSPSAESISSAPEQQNGSAAKPSATADEKLDINVPLLVVNSESFTVWKEHYYKVYEIVKRVEAKAWFMTLGELDRGFSFFSSHSPF